jgi:hypothetical protein
MALRGSPTDVAVADEQQHRRRDGYFAGARAGQVILAVEIWGAIPTAALREK